MTHGFMSDTNGTGLTTAQAISSQSARVVRPWQLLSIVGHSSHGRAPSFGPHVRVRVETLQELASPIDDDGGTPANYSSRCNAQQ